MRSLIPSLAVLLMLTGCSADSANKAIDPVPVWTAIQEDIDLLGLVGGAVVVVHGDEQWTRTFGTSDAARLIPVDQGTVFGVGSLAKPLLADWLSRQPFDVKTPIAALWPELDLGLAGAITVEQAIDQASGLARDDAAWLGRTLSPQDAAEIVREAVVVAPPGEAFTYNSVVFALALEGAARRLGMPVPWTGERRPPAVPFEITLDSALVAVEPFDHGILAAAVDARISPNEMRAVLPALIDSAAPDGTLPLQADAPERACCPFGRAVRYGNGWFVEEFDGQWVYSHSGNGIGATAVLMVVPELSLGVVVFVNQDHADGFVHAVRYRLLLVALGRDGAQADIPLRFEIAQRQVRSSLALSLGKIAGPIEYGGLAWPTALLTETGSCRVVLRGPLLGEFIGTDCTKP